MINWTLAGRAIGIFIPAILVLGSCSGIPSLNDLKFWSKKPEKLSGKREPVLSTGGPNTSSGELEPASKPLVLPAPYTNQDWSQPGGNPRNAPGHLSLGSSLKKVWTADIGSSSSSSGRVTVSPIIYGEHIFTLDALGSVAAFSIRTGSLIWSRSLLPKEENNSNFTIFTLFTDSDLKGGHGGGLAADNGFLYVASGFGNVISLDPKTGKTVWKTPLNSPIRTAPTATKGRVFVITIDGRFHCLSGRDGTLLWSTRGLPQQASLVMSSSPAVGNGTVVGPYPSGDILALNIKDGQAVWTESLSRTHLSSQLAALSDAARPSIGAGIVYAIGHAGRMVATQLSTGKRIWSVNLAGTQAPWVSGNNVFVVDTSGQLRAISHKEGKVYWSLQLSASAKWSGPVLAGGFLWLTSSSGKLIGVDATRGKLSKEYDLGSPIFIPPVVAQGRIYILTDKARLIAMN